jgi:hypothetical protein
MYTLIRLKPYLISAILFVIIASVLLINQLPIYAQVSDITPVSDPCAFREVTDNRIMVEIYSDAGTVTYRESDLSLDIVIIERVADERESTIYSRQCSPVDTAQTDIELCRDELARPMTEERLRQCLLSAITLISP